MRKSGWRVSESEEGRGCEGGVHRLRELDEEEKGVRGRGWRKRRGVRGRDWRKRRGVRGRGLGKRGCGW